MLRGAMRRLNEAFVESLTARHALLAPLERLEERLVRFALAHPARLHPRDLEAIRYALALARLLVVRLEDGSDQLVLEQTAELREACLQRLVPAVGESVSVPGVEAAVGPLAALTRSTRARLVVQLAGRLSDARLERELTRRSLVLVCGGGGGSAYGQLGCFALLESAGLKPLLLAGASMGAALALFRARSPRFDLGHAPRIMSEVAAQRLFRPVSGTPRWSLPSPLRIALREGISPYFSYDGVPLRLRDLPIPLLVTVAGVRRDGLPAATSPYGWLSRKVASVDDPLSVRGLLGLSRMLIGTVRDLVRRPEVLRNVVLGETDETRGMEVIDAVGLSSAVPGVLHYELARDTGAEVDRLQAILAARDVVRTTDGGVTDNVPARSAWRAVQRGMVGTRNVFILALDGFAPRATTPLWLPLQVIAHENVRRSIPYAHHYQVLRRSLSPVSLLPTADEMMSVAEACKGELLAELPYIQRMMEPLPGLAALPG